MEVAVKVYVGNGKYGRAHLKALRLLAKQHFKGSLSALYNSSADKTFGSKLPKKT